MLSRVGVFCRMLENFVWFMWQLSLNLVIRTIKTHLLAIPHALVVHNRETFRQFFSSNHESWQYLRIVVGWRAGEMAKLMKKETKTARQVIYLRPHSQSLQSRG